jgi:hypothetical protein
VSSVAEVIREAPTIIRAYEPKIERAPEDTTAPTT